MSTPAASADEIFAHARDNRLLAADLVEGLTEAQLDTPSLCAGWSVRTVAGHLLMPMEVSVGRLLVRAVRGRSLDVASGRISAELGAAPAAELAARLRVGADTRFTPPGLGPLGPMTDTAIHLRDMARPLGSGVTPSAACWALVLDFLATPTARRGFVPRGRLDGLTWRATDQPWEHGTGPLVEGPSEALALALTGRVVALADLSGDGVARLRP